MRPPHVQWGSERNNMYNTRELFVEGKSLGMFDAWAEDASQFSIDKVLMELRDRGLIEYDGLPQ